MKLIDLDPRWLMKDGKRVGFIFRSPTRGHENWWTSCFETPPQRREQWELFRAATGDERTVQGCKPTAHWQIAGGIDNATFEMMTVTPSIDGSSAGNWHGFITNGEIVGGI